MAGARTLTPLPQGFSPSSCARWRRVSVLRGPREMTPGSLTLAVKLAPAAARDSGLAHASAGRCAGLWGEEPACRLLAVLDGDLKALASSCLRQIPP